MASTKTPTPVTDPSPSPAADRRLTFRSGGWVLVLAAVLGVAIFAIVVVPALQANRDRPPGDGQNPATYGFILEPASIDVSSIVAGQLHRDVIAPIDGPEVVAGTSIDAINREMRGKYIVPSDAVVGVTIDGVSRAYPVSVLALHEVINDTLGGVPIAVTLSPMSHGIRVVERRRGDRVFRFGTSGLLLNSGTLLYDRANDDGPAIAPVDTTPSLWSQLRGVPVVGPESSDQTPLATPPFSVTSWKAWLEQNPDTTVLGYDAVRHQRVKQLNYARYWLYGDLQYPIEPLPPAMTMSGGMALTPKTWCVAIESSADDMPRTIVPVPWIEANMDADPLQLATKPGDLPPGRTGQMTRTIDGRELTFRFRERPPSVDVVDESGSPVAAPMGFWFAWYSSGEPYELIEPATVSEGGASDAS